MYCRNTVITYLMIGAMQTVIYKCKVDVQRSFRQRLEQEVQRMSTIGRWGFLRLLEGNSSPGKKSLGSPTGEPGLPCPELGSCTRGSLQNLRMCFCSGVPTCAI